MISALSIAFLLDYSGSMDQVIDSKPKIQTLKEQVGSVLEGAHPELEHGVIMFGSNPKLGCRDLVSYQYGGVVLKDKIEKARPGTFGKTPLAQGIRQLGKLILSRGFQTAVVLTDGGDSCNGDPCHEIQTLDRQVGLQNQKISLFLIGYDLKDESSNLQCLKQLQLKNISLKQLDADDSKSLHQALKQAQEAAISSQQHQDSLGTKPESSLKGPGSTPEANQQDKASQSQRTSPSGSAKAGTESSVSLAIAYVEITGAPVSAEFLATPQKGLSRTWRGDFILQLTPGDYSVRFQDPRGLEKKLTLVRGQHVRIPWGELISDAQSSLVIRNPLMGFELQPQEQTKKIHGNIKPIKVTVDSFDPNYEKQVDVPIGDWKVIVLSPPWLVGVLPEQALEVLRGQNQSMDLLSIYQQRLKIISNGSATSMSALEVSKVGDQSLTQAYLIPEGQIRIPVGKDQKVRLLQARP